MFLSLIPIVTSADGRVIIPSTLEYADPSGFANHTNSFSSEDTQNKPVHLQSNVTNINKVRKMHGTTIKTLNPVASDIDHFTNHPPSITPVQHNKISPIVSSLSSCMNTSNTITAAAPVYVTEFTRSIHAIRSRSKRRTLKLQQCKVCGKCFKRNTNLKQHMRIHTNERPFKCKVCDKGFHQKHSLIDHERIHSGEKPFECNICGKRFRVKYNVTVHKRNHTGEKPYKCKLCGKAYASKSAYSYHAKTHIL